MVKKYRFYLFLFFISGIVYFSGCTTSKTSESEEEETSNPEITYEETQGTVIMNAAEEEQLNDMYAKSSDSTCLYWLNDKYLKLKNRTKCNIFALNVLYKSGFKTPKVNTLTKDLVDTSRLKDILPIVGISDHEGAKKGDLIAWNGHVIIFEYLVQVKNDMYAMAWWAGTSQKDNGDNIQNNVIHGKYKLNGYYVVRRPVKK